MDRGHDTHERSGYWPRLPPRGSDGRALQGSVRGPHCLGDVAGAWARRGPVAAQMLRLPPWARRDGRNGEGPASRDSENGPHVQQRFGSRQGEADKRRALRNAR